MRYNIDMKTVLLDGNSILNRAYYAMPYLTDTEGRPTNAVYGFMTMLNKIITDIKPDKLAAAFDLRAPTFRHKVCDYYKATRKPMPDDLAVQVPVLKELLRSMDIAVVELEGYEADDIIGTLSERDEDTVIVTGDRDALQLISDKTTVWLTKRGISEVVVYDRARLLEDGLEPYQIVELKSLMGDSSDNIKGVTGVGEKTARELIEKYASLDGVYAHIDEIGGKLHDKLADGKAQAEHSRFLATIDRKVPLEISEEAMRLKQTFPSTAREMFVKLNFNSLVNRYKFDMPDASGEETAVRRKVEIVNVNSLEEIKKITSLDHSFFIDRDSVRLANCADTEYVLPLKQGLIAEGFDLDEIFKAAFLSDSLTIVHDKKSLLHMAEQPLKGKFFDTYLAEYLIDAAIYYENADKLFEKYGADKATPAAELFAIYDKQKQKLIENKLDKLYYEVELPLTDVLYDMEKVGMCVDLATLDKLGKGYKKATEELKNSIYEMAGVEFNVNSTRQLAEVLFDRLGLPHGKKNKTGYSLAADELEKLKGKHEIIELILRYRMLAKLNSTYIEGIRQLVSDGRVHTVFKQGLTVTGRLSSTEPNLQNIPVRDKEAMELRRMFVADDGCLLVSADYSQIELRLLAHFSKDKQLVKAYNDGEDIHRITAAAVHNVTPLEVTAEMRQRSKAVNFGIIYGISDYGLAENLKISPKTAHAFIERYFATYPTVKEFMKKNVEDAKRDGYIRTLLGRIRRFPELQSSNFNVRSFGERAAMNMPLQGTAADIIKVAMIKVYKALKAANLKSKLVLQVHDELIVNAPVGEVDEVKRIMTENMEGAVKLSVPLTVEVAEGKDWYGAH